MRCNWGTNAQSVGLPPEKKVNLPVFEIARVLVRFDHIASRIVNANHSIM
jgi:hypothetical protein